MFKIKKIIICLLIVASIFLIQFILPCNVYGGEGTYTPGEGEGTYTYTITNNQVTITDYIEGQQTIITIPSTVEGYPVTNIGNNAFYDCSSLTEITIIEGVTSIGGSAFKYCSSLTEITIPEGVTSIGDYAFFCCSSLTEITIPEGVTSIGDSAFDSCSSLTEINVDENNTKYSSIDGILFNKDKTSIIKYPARKTVTKYAIPSSVTSIGWTAFNGCSSLTEITIPGGVTNIGDYAFYNCSSLAEITIPGGVTNIGNYVFNGCSSLREITIPEGVTSIGDSAFDSCSSLTKITIPEGVTSIGLGAFYDCSSLTEITIPSSVTSIGDSAFDSCSSLTEINVDENNTKYSSIDGILFNKDKTSIIKYTARKTVTKYAIPSSVTSIGWAAFNGCSSLTEITIPEGVTSIGDYAFFCCSSLTEITIPEGVTSIGDYAFLGCSSLTEITIPGGVTNIGDYEFYECSSLTKITISEGVTSIGWAAFYNCSSLTEIIIPSSVTTIGVNAFQYCNKLTVYYKSNTVAASYTYPEYVKCEVDDEAPEVDIVEGENEEGKLTAQVKGTDNKAGIKDIKYIFTKNKTATKEEFANGQIISTGEKIIIDKQEKIYNLHILAEDKLGNYIIKNEEIIAELKKIEVTTPPSKTKYIAGQDFESTGMKVTATYNDGTSNEVINFTVTDETKLTADKTNVTISYTENGVTKTVTQGITVTAREVDINIFKETSGYAINEEGYITGVQAKTDIATYKSNLSQGITVKIIKGETEVKTGQIGTGMTTEYYYNGEKIKTAIIVITGDCTGDGEIEIKDMVRINNYRLYKTTTGFGEVYQKAADVNKDGKIEIKDMVRINNYRLYGTKLESIEKVM